MDSPSQSPLDDQSLHGVEPAASGNWGSISDSMSLAGPGLSTPGDRFGRLGRLVRKELLEILRDRRTIVTLVLMPVLLYPLLSIAFQQFFLVTQLSLQQDKPYRLGYLSRAETGLFQNYLVDGEQELAKQ